MRRIFVEAWDPEYGSAFSPGEMAPSRADVDPSIEVPIESWKPIGLDRGAPVAERGLFPIGALERELRRRLGEHAIVHRALKAAAARDFSLEPGAR